MDKKENRILSFFITTLNGMAYGLFASLIIGTIIGTIGKLFPSDINSFCTFMNTTLTNVATVFLFFSWAAIGVGVALALKLDSLKTIVY